MATLAPALRTGPLLRYHNGMQSSSELVLGLRPRSPSGFFRVRRGENDLALESDCTWASPGAFTETNYPCHVDGGNCGGNATAGK